jgi:DNA modification methylase
MKTETVPIACIKPYLGNPRHNDAAVDAVARSLAEFGWRQPIVVDPEYVIVVGHTRYKAAQKLGCTEVPVHVATDLTPEQIRAYRIADNQTATLAEWNYDLLPIELGALNDVNYDRSLLGFDPDELRKLLHGDGPTEGLCDPDDVPEPPAEAITQPGDLWLLGEHRLLCGDSTNGSDVARLFGAEHATMCFTDPPWNVAIGKDSNPRHRQRAGLANDDLSPEDFSKFLESFIKHATPRVRGDVYCVLGASEWPTLDRTLWAAGYHWSATIIWAKDAFVLGRSKYHRRYEPLWYGWHESNTSSFGDRRDLDDVWEISRPRRSEEHPTMKPVELAVRAIGNSSKAGDVIYEPFGGSGSTLIAAEQLGRRCYAIELSPQYVDVIVRRYEEFTGNKAVRQSAQEAA